MADDIWRQISENRWERQTSKRRLIAAACKHVRGYWYAYTYHKKPAIVIDRPTAEEAMAALDESLDSLEQAITELRTEPAFLTQLQSATSRSLSHEEIERQRLSFVMGSLPAGKTVTREEVQDVLDRQRGSLSARE